MADGDDDDHVVIIVIVFTPSPLSLYDGIKLLELLADKIHLATSSFINIRYLHECEFVCECVRVSVCVLNHTWNLIL